MDSADLARLEAELAAVETELASPAVAATLERVQGFHSMARHTAANVEAFDQHLSRLTDPAFAHQLLDNKNAGATVQYVERFQHLVIAYVTSAISLLEHIALHVETHFPDPAHKVRLEHDAGLGIAINVFDGHLVVRQIRHMVTHRQAPKIKLIAGRHVEQQTIAVIDRRQILADKRCGKDVRALLESLHHDEISIDGLVHDDAVYVMEFVDWFARILALHSLGDLEPIDRLIARRDTILAELQSTIDGSGMTDGSRESPLSREC